MQPKPKILVVDDERSMVAVVRSVLEAQGYQVCEAYDGKECLRIASKELPDVILLDVQMPEMDGFKALEHLQADTRTKEIPVIILTAVAKDSRSIDAGLSLGAQEYLTKPISRDELLVRIASVLRADTARRELERVKSDFTSMVVHDLRNPLSAIKGSVEFLLEEKLGQLNEDQKEVLNISLHASTQMLNLTNDILDLSKFESGKVQLTKKSVAISNVIQDVMNRMRWLTEEKHISTTFTVEKTLPAISIDINKIDQTLSNLLSNAIKFTPEYGAITFRAKQTDILDQIVGGTRTYIEISISDTGAGIDPDELPLLFDKYKQTKTGKLAKEKGTGLGLAICKGIVEAHGGKIWVDSKVGKGSTFYFTLPTES